ncbi:hypothetical protein ACC710_38115, partial [Rhizobium ruizarguesonis]
RLRPAPQLFRLGRELIFQHLGRVGRAGEQPADSNEFLTAANEFFKRVENWKIVGAGETTACKIGAADGPNAVVMIF